MAMLRSQIKQAQEEGRVVIFTDECMFTTARMLRLAYSGLRTNINIDDKLRQSDTIAMLGGVSA
jgi:hypothetical protein